MTLDIEEELSRRHFETTAGSDSKRNMDLVVRPLIRMLHALERRKRLKIVKCKRKTQKAARRLHRSK